MTEHHLDDLLQLCPQVVLGKYVTITSIDSGPYFPTLEEIAVGWERRNGIAYSPRVEKVELLPREGWDEWYVFEERVDLGGMAGRGLNPFTASLSPGEIYAFVNYNFSLSHMQGIEPYFWKQFGWIHPQTYIAESDFLLQVITSDKKLFECAREALTALESTSDIQAESDDK